MIGKCAACGRRICQRCQDAYGAFCSEMCMASSSQADIEAMPQFGLKSTRVGEKQGLWALQHLIFKVITWSVVIAIIGGISYFVWLNFLDPSGNIKWELEFASDQAYLTLLSSKNNIAVLQTHAGYTTINVSNGQKLKNIEIQRPEEDNVEMASFIGAGLSRTIPIKEGFLTIDRTSLYTFTSDWKLGASIELDTAPSSFEVSPDGRIWIGLSSHRSAPDDLESFDFRYRFITLDLSTGKELWRKMLKQGMHVFRVVAMNDLVLALITKPGEDNMPMYILAALNAETGRNLWHKRLESAPEWGPLGWGDAIYLMVENQIRAYTKNGEPLWVDRNGNIRTIAFPDGTSPFVFIKDDMVLATLGGETLCYDLTTGKGKWKVRAQFGETGIHVIGDKVFIVGYITKKGKTVNLEKMQGFDQAPEVLEDFGLQGGVSLDKEIPVLMCLDKASGNIIWKVDNAFGDIITGNNRLVRVMRAEHTTTALLRERPETYLFQYDLDDGEVFFSKTYKEVDLLGSKIVGRYLLGYTVDQQNQVRKKDPETLVMYTEKVNVKGRLIAFRLR